MNALEYKDAVEAVLVEFGGVVRPIIPEDVWGEIDKELRKIAYTAPEIISVRVESVYAIVSGNDEKYDDSDGVRAAWSNAVQKMNKIPYPGDKD